MNPVLRRPVRAGARVWLENEETAATVDLANTAYMLMLRLIAHSYLLPRPHPAKALCVDLALGLDARDDAARRARGAPAGGAIESRTAMAACRSPRCAMPRRCRRASAPESFSSSGCVNWRRGAQALAAQRRCARDAGVARSSTTCTQRAERTFANIEQDLRRGDCGRADAAPRASRRCRRRTRRRGVIEPGNVAPTPRTVDGVDYIEGRDLTLIYEGKKCIHSRFCVTWGPKVFIANVKGPWINPDAMSTEALTEIAHVCVSGAIRYKRKDGQPDEAPPPVNLISVREGGPYAIRADIRLDGAPPASYRLTLCRCGASKNKPFCDGSHHEVNFAASGEPPTGKADMLPVRDGPLAIDPLTDGPLQVRGNMEIISGTGRVVARVESARLCRCGASNNKPFCDGSHARVGFRS